MADTKLTALTAETVPLAADLAYIVDDVAGTPTSKKITLENLIKVINDLTADATPSTDDLVATINDPGGTPASRKVTLLNLFQTLGPVAQIVNTQTGAVATGTTTIPTDDTIPQITEGTEFMTLNITPKATTNKLKIDVVLSIAHNAATNQLIVVALFQDATANALAVMTANALQNINTNLKFTHYMSAGTTSSTTFRVRAGTGGASTVTVNGQAGARLFGGVMASSITITEIRA